MEIFHYENAIINFVLDYRVDVHQIDNFKIILRTKNNKLLLTSSAEMKISESTISRQFTKEINTKKISIYSNGTETKTKIEVLK